MWLFGSLKDMAELGSYNQKKLQLVGEKEDAHDLARNELSDIHFLRLVIYSIISMPYRRT